MNHYTLTAGARRRLEKVIFTELANKTHGHVTGRMEREVAFTDVRGALVHLMRDVHFEPTVSISDKVKAFRELHDRMQAAELQDFSPEKLAKLDMWMQIIVAACKKVYNTRFTAEDIDRFVRLATLGREYFASEFFNPEEFISEELLLFAKMIGENFAAYNRTLNHEHI